MARCGDHAWVALLARCRMTLALVVATVIGHSASLTCRGQNGRRSAKVPDEALEGLKILYGLGILHKICEGANII
jgi:hypothetical protein